MTILCIGDSLTFGYGVPRDECWCALASRLTGHSFVNRGVNGATSGEMLELARAVLPDWPEGEVFVMGGLNDLFMGMPLRVPLEHIREICRLARAHGLRPVAGIPMPMAESLDDGWCDGPIDMTKVRAAYADFAEALLRRCAEDGVPVLDFRPVVGPAELAFDGIHVNRQGHRRMAEAAAAHWGCAPEQESPAPR